MRDVPLEGAAGGGTRETRRIGVRGFCCAQEPCTAERARFYGDGNCPKAQARCG